MGIKFTRLLLGMVTLFMVTGAAMAQDGTTLVGTATTSPASYRLNGITHIWQGWNNCGPATTTMALTYFGAAADQYPAAGWLKPNSEDKNVSPWEIVDYVNTQIPGTTRALMRYGGDLELLKTLISSNIPVMIESGYDPVNDDQGWMGHYLLMSGYDDSLRLFYTQDSYEGPNFTYTYDDIEFFWRHFNRVYIVFYEMTREEEVLALLGDDADERQNAINALEQARTEAIANPQDPFAWFNMGTNFLQLEMYNEAATAFDQARNVGEGLPWRMMWYQFGPFEAYYQVGRYNDILLLAQASFTDGGGHFVEETFYYAGLAREALGEQQRALDNFNQAVFLNRNYDEARVARDRLQNS
jgi:hypothetical protein